jgi:hypothetical protein
MLSFGNSLGFIALLALPAIFAIHFLQRESRRVVTSTLFLLDQLAPESAQGRRFERLRNSVPLWLQIISALLITWLLVQPRWLQRQSTHRVVIVLDSSVSMLAFRDELLRNLAAQTGRLSRAAARTEWHLLESDTTQPKLYSGTDRNALLGAVERWKPHLGSHDFSPALQIGQTLLRGNGTIIFATDRRCVLPAEVKLLAVGKPLENCGFAGANFDGAEWHVLVRNYGQTRQQRTWWIESSGQRSPEQEVSLDPGQALALTGSMPAGADACELVLSPDAFTLDDRLPLVLPKPKRLQVAATANPAFAEFFTQLSRSIEAADPAPGKADLQFSVYNALAPRLPDTTAVVFLQDPAPSKNLLAENVVAENHPLNAELNWSGLLCRDSLRVPPKPGDQTLVWQGDRPLIFLRESGATSLLVVNFDLRASNATRLPAFVLLLHRFVERIRAGKIAPETRNVETNQLLTVAADPALPPPTIAEQPAAVLRAPFQPGFFDVRQANSTLLHGAAHFADAREADFREAASFDGVGDTVERVIQQNSEADFLTPIWTLLLACSIIASWIWRQS